MPKNIVWPSYQNNEDVAAELWRFKGHVFMIWETLQYDWQRLSSKPRTTYISLVLDETHLCPLDSSRVLRYHVFGKIFITQHTNFLLIHILPIRIAIRIAVSFSFLLFLWFLCFSKSLFEGLTFKNYYVMTPSRSTEIEISIRIQKITFREGTSQKILILIFKNID